MTVGVFCKCLNPHDLILIIDPEGDFASGVVSDMSEYFDEEILHISANKYANAYRANNNIGYELHVA